MNSKFSIQTYLVIGLMLFALFFGAGNLIYPAFLGTYAGQNLLLAIFAFCLTAVTLPLLGVVAIGFAGVDGADQLAQKVSKPYARIFTIILYLAIGPFFAIPRTGATSYAIAVLPFATDQLWTKALYALLFFGTSYLLAIKPSKLADNLGKYLTPLLLLVLGIIVVASYIHPAGGFQAAMNASSNVSDAFADHPFFAGLIQGYGTMDALAALAFSVIVINATKQFGAKSKVDIAKLTLGSGLVATSLLAIIYYLVARIGATSATLFQLNNGLYTYQGAAIDGSSILSQAATFYLGSFGQIALAVVIFLACLSTASGLISACANYFNQIIPKLSLEIWAALFTLIASFFYFGGLSELLKWSLPLLYLLYPLTIVLIALSLTENIFKPSHKTYQITIIFTSLAGLYDAFSTLSSLTGYFTLPSPLQGFFTEVIPLGNVAMSWISFAITGFILGKMLEHIKKS